MKTTKTIARWALVPIAAVGAWYVALFIGVFLYAAAQSTGSDQTYLPTFGGVEAAIFCFSTALSAVFVVTAAYCAAPEHHVAVAWIALAIGTVTALCMALDAAEWSVWGMFASATAAGSLTVVVLSRRHARVASGSAT